MHLQEVYVLKFSAEEMMFLPENYHKQEATDLLNQEL